MVIRLSAMGDVAMTVPVLKTLTDSYPELQITVLTKAFFKPIFSGLKNVQIHTVDVSGRHKGILGLWKLYKELKVLHIDAVADLHNVLRSNILKLFFRLSGIPFVQIDKGRKDKKALTSLKNKDFKPLKTSHERYADVFKQLGYQLDLKMTQSLPKNALSEDTLRIVGTKSKKWLGIAPFATFTGKMYPLHLMKEVIQELNKNEKYRIFLFGGGPEEKNVLDVWDNQFQNCINIVGKLSFEDELQLISNLDLMISMDSGNGHLASIYGVPTITLWGVTHPHAGFYPFGQDADNAILADRNKYPLIPTSVYGNKAPKTYDKAMETIHPKDVINKIKELSD